MERLSCSSGTAARSREREAPLDRARRPVEASVREESVQIEYENLVQRTSAGTGQGRGKRSKNLDQRYSRNSQTEGPTAGEWATTTRAIRAHRDEDINRALQREALGSPEEQEEQYVRALGEAYQKYRK